MVVKKKTATAGKSAVKDEKQFRTGKTLANSHRPKQWDDVCGHVKSVSRLKGMIKSRDIPNALLFTGPSGTGKTTLARVFARYLNCETNTSCGTCPSCVMMDNRTHPDYEEMNGADKRGIDDIRGLEQQAKMMPMMGNLRIIVIDEAQQITPQGQQALLKILEEPPECTLFMICSMEPEKLNAAMFGRCQHMELSRVDANAVADHLTHIAETEEIEGISEAAFHLIAEATGGQLRNALQTLDAVRQVIRGQDEELDDDELEALVNESIIDAAGASDELVSVKILTYIYASVIKDKPTLPKILETALDVQNAVAFANAMLYQNSFLINKMVAPGHKSLYFTATNKELVKTLNLYVTHRKAFGDKPQLSLLLTAHRILMELRVKLVTMGGQDTAMIQLALFEAWSTVNELAYPQD